MQCCAKIPRPVAEQNYYFLGSESPSSVSKIEDRNGLSTSSAAGWMELSQARREHVCSALVKGDFGKGFKERESIRF